MDRLAYPLGGRLTASASLLADEEHGVNAQNAKEEPEPEPRALPPGAQYTKWHEASAARGDYASGRAVRPMEPCCQGALKGAFGG